MASRAATEYRYEKLTWPDINEAVELGKVASLVARIALEVLVRGELRGVDEDGGNDETTLLASGFHQANVPGVEGAHRRDEADGLIALARGGDRLADGGDRADDGGLHGSL